MKEQLPDKMLLDVSEAQRVLGLGRSHLYRFILDGSLPTVKLGRRRKIPVESLRQFIDRLKDESADGR